MLCGVTAQAATEFRRTLDEVTADPSVLGISAADETKEWRRDGADYHRQYDIGNRFIEVVCYGSNGKVTISYPKHYDICGEGGAPPLLTPEISPEGVPEPVRKSGSRGSLLYPELGRKARVSGRVILQAVVGHDGVLKDICVAQGLGNGLYGFEQAAIQAVKTWRYEPVVRDGLPIEVTKKFRLDFPPN